MSESDTTLIPSAMATYIPGILGAARNVGAVHWRSICHQNQRPLGRCFAEGQIQTP